MRPITNTASGYQPADPPADPALLQTYLRAEFAKMSAALDAVAAGFAPVAYAYPARPRDGMLRNFDGTTINPGSGAGLYRFGAGTWHFLG